MGITTLIARGAQKGADKIAKLSSLSPEQLKKVQKQREAYLLEKPDPNDSESIELTGRLLASASTEIFNAYLPQISKIYVPIDKNAEYKDGFKTDSNIRYVNITKWVVDSKENSLEKLINVYEVLSNEECNIGLIFHRSNLKTKVYLSVSNLKNSDSKADVDSLMERLINAVNGNFPGSEFFVKEETGTKPCEKYSYEGTIPCLKDEEIEKCSVASITNIPTEKSEKFISQTIEKLLDGIVPSMDGNSDYTIVLLATPILDIEERKLHLAELYSGLIPYAEWQTNFTFTDTSSTSSSATFGINVGASAGVQNGTNQSLAQNDSITKSDGASEGKSITETEAENVSHTETEGNSDTTGGGASFIAHTEYSHSWNESTADTIGKTTSNSVTQALTKTLGRALTKGVTRTVGTAKNLNLGANFGANFARSSTVTATIGKNEGITQSFTNYNIKHALEKLEMQMKRMDTSSALGFWDFGAYVISKDYNIANNVAHSYLALTQGEESFMSQSAINLWNGNLTESGNMSAESGAAKEICSYLQELRHPIFALDENVIKEDSTFNVYPPIVTATTGLSGKELAYSLNFPKKSIAGLPVLECAEFGRNISTYKIKETEDDKKLKLGKVFHMHHEENQEVKLDSKSLCSHTFITGSTGSGKSNTVYQMLSEIKKAKVNFLVVEPAKGEYKDMLGNDNDVTVYGTNPQISNLLRINPFSFPNRNNDPTKNIHILEHLDRLVEIFNVCWPMYAAMPAVLKEAVEKSYEDCGWNLTDSINEYGEDLYPTFTDVTRNIRTIIDSSEYDAENKGAYKGALITRLKSLSNGINGLVFTSDELSNEDLFKKNVIVDLSRVGSAETKSLIMGLLVLKLQEYRMTTGGGNKDLQHVTVLEEAHNLLKRTSTEQSQDSGNLLGKSVEMLTNAIAEMRTYGEGFIIADQAPGLLDMAVIRNTNTKIIMRLPDLGDRELVGKAANLNDNQIEELAKLPTGVAAVYQNNWVQPVLCKVDHYKDGNRGNFKPKQDETHKVSLNERIDLVKKICFHLTEISEDNADLLKKVSGVSYFSYMQYKKSHKNKPNYDKLSYIVSSLLPEFSKTLKDSALMNPSKVTIWRNDLQEHIENVLRQNNQFDIELRNSILQCVLQNYVLCELNKPSLLNELLNRKVQ